MDKKWIKLKMAFSKNSTAGVVFALPFIIGFFVFMVIPMGMSLYYSFCEFEILGAPKFIGLGNYVKMFTEDETFYKSISVTFFYALVSVPLRLVFALIVALILKQTTKATGIYRAAYYLPSIIGGSVAISILWKRLFAEDGTFNHLLPVSFLAWNQEYRDMGFDSPGSLAVWFFHADFSFCIKADFNLPL